MTCTIEWLGNDDSVTPGVVCGVYRCLEHGDFFGDRYDGVVGNMPTKCPEMVDAEREERKGRSKDPWRDFLWELELFEDTTGLDFEAEHAAWVAMTGWDREYFPFKIEGTTTPGWYVCDRIGPVDGPFKDALVAGNAAWDENNHGIRENAEDDNQED